MRIPPRTRYVRQWEINGQPWQVKIVKRMPKGAAKCAGFCDYKKQTIYLSAQQSDVDLFATFIHEFCHAALPHVSENSVRGLEQAFLGLWVNL